MTITVDDSAVKRIETIRMQQGKPALLMRLTVEGGGCSGFQYKWALEEAPGEKDTVFAGALVTDDISLSFLKDARIRFEKSLIGEEWKIENPNAVAGCGCGTSFAV
jgi:iron-sulfur cluster insertion protein